MTNMFKLLKKEEIATVNPFNGCKFGCYKEDGGCWAYRMAQRQKGKGVKGYENGFEPSWCPWRMDVPKDSDIVFVGSMGDIAFQPLGNIEKIIKEMIKPNPDTTFFFETKDPSTYLRFSDKLPHNVVLSATIETNRDYGVSKALIPQERFESFEELFQPTKNLFERPEKRIPNKHISIEPVMDFDLPQLESMICQISPEVGVSIGYDNYNLGLPEPSPEKFYRLIEELDEYFHVEIKTRPEDLNRFD